MSFAHVDLEGLVFWCPPSPLALIFFPPPLLQGSLSPEGRDLVETSLLELFISSRVFQDLFLCVMSGCGSGYLLPSAAGGSFSDDG